MLFLLLILILCTSVFLTGASVLFQFVLYPLFHKVSAFDIECYFKKYQIQATRILVPLFILDVLFTVLLPFMPLRSNLSNPLLLSFVMMAFAYFNFLLLQVPLNLQFKESQNPVIINKMIKYNWISVISCSIRVVLIVLILLRLHS
jgi:hypothetical protein